MHDVTVIKGHLGQAQQSCTLLLQPLAGLQSMTITVSAYMYILQDAGMHDVTVIKGHLG